MTKNKKSMHEQMAPMARKLLLHVIEDNLADDVINGLTPDSIRADLIRKSVVDLVDAVPYDHLGAVGSLIMMLNESNTLSAMSVGAWVHYSDEDLDSIVRKVHKYRKGREDGTIEGFGDEDES